MSDAFISYSRNNREVAKKLVEVMEQKGTFPWIDWQGIFTAEPNFWHTIETAIAEANAFVFLMSPDSWKSIYCNLEIAHALELKKRIIPVSVSETDDGDIREYFASQRPSDYSSAEKLLDGKAPLKLFEDNWKAIGDIHWLTLTSKQDNIEENDAKLQKAPEKIVAELQKALERDFEYVEKHTRYLTRAQQWEKEEKSPHLLLIGKSVDEAREWLKKGEELKKKQEETRTNRDQPSNPIPIQLHHEFIDASKRARHNNRAVRRVTIISVLVLFVVAGLFSLQASNAATRANASNTEAALARADIQAAEATLAPLQTTSASLALEIVVQQEIIDSFTRASLDIAQGRTSDAINRMNEVVDRYPDQALAHTARGLIYAANNELDAAIRDYSEAIRINPDNAETYLFRGRLFLDKDQYESAAEDFHTAIDIDQDYVEAYIELGEVYLIRNNRQEAREAYLLALDIDDEAARAHFGLGQIFTIDGDLDDAILRYEAAIDSNPTFADAHFNLANIYNRRAERGLSVNSDGDRRKAAYHWRTSQELGRLLEPEQREQMLEFETYLLPVPDKGLRPR